MRDTPAGLDPRTCVLCAAGFSIAAACVENMAAALAALGMGMASLALSRGVWPTLPRKLAAVNIFILFIWLVTPFTTPGQPVWQWHFLQITDAGLRLAALASIKANALAAVFIALVASLPMQYLDNALARLHCPEKLSWIFVMLRQNVHILQKEWFALNTAARLRGFAPATNMHTYRTIASMLAILLIRAINRAERLRDALLLKGFDGHFPLLVELRYARRDIIFAMLAAGCVFFLLILDKGWPHG